MRKQGMKISCFMGKYQDPKRRSQFNSPSASCWCNAVESDIEHVYLGRKIASDGHSTRGVRRIALAASAISQL